MISYIDNAYGCDADGNRGIKQWFHEVESSDSEHILDALKELKDEFDPIAEGIPDLVEITFNNHLTDDDVQISVDTSDFLSELSVYKIVTEDNFKLFVDTLVKYDKNLGLKLSLYLIERLSAKH